MQEFGTSIAFFPLGEPLNGTSPKPSAGLALKICASEEKWDELFVQPEAKNVMREMAHEALKDYRAGRTTDIATLKTGGSRRHEIRSNKLTISYL